MLAIGRHETSLRRLFFSARGSLVAAKAFAYNCMQLNKWWDPEAGHFNQRQMFVDYFHHDLSKNNMVDVLMSKKQHGELVWKSKM